MHSKKGLTRSAVVKCYTMLLTEWQNKLECFSFVSFSSKSNICEEGQKPDYIFGHDSGNIWPHSGLNLVVSSLTHLDKQKAEKTLQETNTLAYFSTPSATTNNYFSSSRLTLLHLDKSFMAACIWSISKIDSYNQCHKNFFFFVTFKEVK
jgi:hypothetical protein